MKKILLLLFIAIFSCIFVSCQKEEQIDMANVVEVTSTNSLSKAANAIETRTFAFTPHSETFTFSYSTKTIHVSIGIESVSSSVNYEIFGIGQSGEQFYIDHGSITSSSGINETYHLSTYASGIFVRLTKFNLSSGAISVGY